MEGCARKQHIGSLKGAEEVPVSKLADGTKRKTHELMRASS
jgi:hypothetical protein